MSVVPRDIVAKIQFFESREAGWQNRAAQIGSSPAEVAALAEKTAAARAAYDAQRRARNAAKDATLALRLAVAAMAGAGGQIIRKVRARAAADGDGVYALASLPAPAAPSPVPPPGRPTNFAVELAAGGALTLKWTCDNPRGARGPIYQVSRRTGTTGPFAVVGATGTKRFLDDTLPAGAASVTYRVVAMRTTVHGPEARFTVNFGVTGAGGATAGAAEQGEARRAA
jgi:hypothetical protein